MTDTPQRNLTPDEVFAEQIRNEGQFQAWLNARLSENGWLHYHTYDSRRSPKGFLDTHAVHVPRLRLLWAELKVGRNKPSPKQRVWLAALRTVALAINRTLKREVLIVRLWYPTDRSEILKVVRGGR